MGSLPLQGKVAIVTGGGRGLGRAMALGLAAAGASVAATAARSSDEIASLANAVAPAGSRGVIVPLVADVTREDDCHRVVAGVVERFGRLDVLVNNAGRGMMFVSPTFMTEPTKFWEVRPDVWRTIIDTNVNGPFLMSRQAVPHMIAGGGGRIINISMNAATMTRRGFSPYGPSKAALEAETTIWAQDLKETGVTVNTLLPGGVTATGMVPTDVPERIRNALLPPDVIVPPLIWLASDLSDGVTGQRIIATEWSDAVAKKLMPHTCAE